MYDLSLKVLHLQAPAGRHFHFSFELADRPANDAAGWVLDEVPNPNPALTLTLTPTLTLTRCSTRS